MDFTLTYFKGYLWRGRNCTLLCQTFTYCFRLHETSTRLFVSGYQKILSNVHLWKNPTKRLLWTFYGFFFNSKKEKKQCTLLAKLNKRFLYTFTFFKNKIERRKKTRIKCLGTYRDNFGFLSIIQNNVSQD